MKIYNYVKLDIETGEILDEESFEYHGPIAKCDGGDSDSESTDDADADASGMGSFGDRDSGDRGYGGGGRERDRSTVDTAFGPMSNDMVEDRSLQNEMNRRDLSDQFSGSEKIDMTADPTVDKINEMNRKDLSKGYQTDEYGRPTNLPDLLRAFDLDRAKNAFNVTRTSLGFLDPLSPMGGWTAALAAGLIGGLSGIPSGPLSEEMQATIDANEANKGNEERSKKVIPLAPVIPDIVADPLGITQGQQTETDDEIELARALRDLRRRRFGYYNTMNTMPLGPAHVYRRTLY